MTTSMETLSSYTIDALPLEILYDIFQKCDLKTMLNLSKVCQHFRQIISQILQQRYRQFFYNYLTFKFSQNLDDQEISELCRLSGGTVYKLRFSTYFCLGLFNHIKWKISSNRIENLRLLTNYNFKKNVKYFPQLQELEIQGKFLQDQTVAELAIRCRKLKSIRLMDGDNRWLSGEHLADLESIENLELQCCRNLDPNHLLTLSQKRKLKSLNIVECEHLKDIPKMEILSQHWLNLHTLRLTAFTQDPKFLKAILAIPSLQCLELFAINSMPLSFEENLFSELSQTPEKSQKITALKFENDREYIENESLQQWTDKKYAVMRENVCINGQAWQWSQEVFEKISQALEVFTNLTSMTFYYCRLLDYDQLQKLPVLNRNLQEIKIYGCPRKEDAQFHKEWPSECVLKFESFLSLKEVAGLLDNANSRQFSAFYPRVPPVMRSIECRF